MRKLILALALALAATPALAQHRGFGGHMGVARGGFGGPAMGHGYYGNRGFYGGRGYYGHHRGYGGWGAAALGLGALGYGAYNYAYPATQCSYDAYGRQVCYYVGY